MHRSCLGHVPLDKMTSKNRIVMAKAQVFFKSSFCCLSLEDCNMFDFRLFLEIQETLKIQTQCDIGYLQTSKSEAILQDGDAVLGALNDNRRFSVAGHKVTGDACLLLACCWHLMGFFKHSGQGMSWFLDVFAHVGGTLSATLKSLVARHSCLLWGTSHSEG